MICIKVGEKQNTIPVSSTKEKDMDGVFTQILRKELGIRVYLILVYFMALGLLMLKKNRSDLLWKKIFIFLKTIQLSNM